MDQPDVRVLSLAMVNDLLLWHGLNNFLPDDDDNDVAGSINVSNIETLLQTDQSDQTTNKVHYFSEN